MGRRRRRGSTSCVSFLEHDGHYRGAPTDDATAISEFERLRRSGASFIVFGWPAFWWLDHYQGFSRHLRSNFHCVLRNERVTDLRPSSRIGHAIMRATNLQQRTRDGVSELRTTIISQTLAAPFELWFRVPAQLAHYIDPDVADLLVPALLLPAMKLGEPLELPAPISPRLAHATTRIQTIFRCWEPRLAMVDVRAPRRMPPDVTAAATALFYSGGVDSSYSLTKNLIAHPLNEDVFTHLISIHGLDVRIGDPQEAVYDRMLTDAEIVARRVGKEVVNVTTNVQELMRMLGIPWGVLGHGSGLASVGLLLQQMFRTIYVAPMSGSYLWTKPSGSHPFLDPLWSTESLTFVHDGCEASRLDRIRMLAAHPIVLDALHVCWSHDSVQYNCGPLRQMPARDDRPARRRCPWRLSDLAGTHRPGGAAARSAGHSGGGGMDRGAPRCADRGP